MTLWQRATNNCSIVQDSSQEGAPKPAKAVKTSKSSSKKALAAPTLNEIDLIAPSGPPTAKRKSRKSQSVASGTPKGPIDSIKHLKVDRWSEVGAVLQKTIVLIVGMVAAQISVMNIRGRGQAIHSN